MCTKGSWVLFNTFDQYPWSTSWSKLNQHPDQYFVNIVLTLGEQSVDSWPSDDQLVWIDWQLVNYWPTVNQDVDRASMECRGVAGVFMEGSSRVSIDNKSQMPLVHTMYDP